MQLFMWVRMWYSRSTTFSLMYRYRGLLGTHLTCKRIFRALCGWAFTWTFYLFFLKRFCNPSSLENQMDAGQKANPNWNQTGTFIFIMEKKKHGIRSSPWGIITILEQKDIEKTIEHILWTQVYGFKKKEPQGTLWLNGITKTLKWWQLWTDGESLLRALEVEILAVEVWLNGRYSWRRG